MGTDTDALDLDLEVPPIYLATVIVHGTKDANAPTLVEEAVTIPSPVHDTGEFEFAIRRHELAFQHKSADDNSKLAYYQVSVLDMLGPDSFKSFISPFFSPRTLHVVCFDSAEYKRLLDAKDQLELDAFVNDNVSRWLRLIFPVFPSAKVIFVATNDQNVDVDAVKSDLSARLVNMVDGVVAAVEFRNGKTFDDAAVRRAVRPTLESPVVMAGSSFKGELPQAIGNSGVGIEMDERIPNALEVIHERRDESEQLINTARVEALVVSKTQIGQLLRSKFKGGSDETITHDDISRVLRKLHDIGETLSLETWFENDSNRFDVTILSPQLVTEILQQLAVCGPEDDAQDDRGRGFVKHGLLVGKPVWQDAQPKVVFGLKRLMEKLTLVSPLTVSMRDNSDLIVPAFWTAKFKKDTETKSAPLNYNSSKRDGDIELNVPFLAEDILKSVALKCSAIERKGKYMTVKGLSPTCYELGNSMRLSIVASGSAIRVESLEGKEANLEPIRKFINKFN
ncbi:hypothetical protein PINS_up021271 [Pythium insidiosum]|nr:hypothetical protein PINS_up021271 [Pythium insidiosum]